MAIRTIMVCVSSAESDLKDYNECIIGLPHRLESPPSFFPSSLPLPELVEELHLPLLDGLFQLGFLFQQQLRVLIMTQRNDSADQEQLLIHPNSIFHFNMASCLTPSSSNGY